MATPETNDPNVQLQDLYAVWGGEGLQKGLAPGLLITGNVMVDRSYLENPRNVVLDSKSNREMFSEWARRTQEHGSKLVMQISHPGKQCPVSVTFEPVAPSAIPMRVVHFRPLFWKPRALLATEIDAVVASFVQAAMLAQSFGFAGVQLHSAHGYLLSQFLSGFSNRRTDQFGGTLSNRFSLLLNILTTVRACTLPGFIVGVKLNSGDFLSGGFSRDEALSVVQWLDETNLVDFIEISGGLV